MHIRSYKHHAQGLVEYALILVLVAIVVIGILALLGSSSSGGLSIPFLSKRIPYAPRIDYGHVEDVIIQDIKVSSVRTTTSPAFTKETKVAIYNFDSPQGTQGGVLVSDSFASALRREGYQIFERSEIERILQEQQLLTEGRVTVSDLDIASRLGQLGSVEYMIFGAVTLYNSQGQDISLPVKVEDTDREIYRKEYDDYRNWYINGFRITLDRSDAAARAESLRTKEKVLSLEELENELQNVKKREFRTVASVGISAKIVNVRTGEIVWMGQAETTDFTLVDAAARVVDELLKTALS